MGTYRSCLVKECVRIVQASRTQDKNVHSHIHMIHHVAACNKSGSMWVMFVWTSLGKIISVQKYITYWVMFVYGALMVLILICSY